MTIFDQVHLSTFDNFLKRYFSHSFAHWFNTAGCSNQNSFFLLLTYILRRLFPVIVLRTRCHVTRFRTFVSVKKKKINFDNTGKQPLQWDWVWEGWWRFGRKETQKLPGSFFVRGFWNKKIPLRRLQEEWDRLNNLDENQQVAQVFQKHFQNFKHPAYDRFPKFFMTNCNCLSSHLYLADAATGAAGFPTREENLVFGPQLPQAGLGRATGGLGRATAGNQRQGRLQQGLNRGQGVQGRRQGGRRQDG